MSVLLQVSDPHFGTERPAVVEALVEFARAQRPQVLVMSGDITQRARPAQFAAARAFVDRLQIEHTLVIAGNHDIPLFNPLSRLLRPYANFARVFGGDLEPIIDTPELLAIAVKATRRLRHTDGVLSAVQIQQVARRLYAATHGQLRLVIAHQPLHVARPRDEHNLVHRHVQAIRAWTEAGMDIVMGGHIHLPFVRSLSQRVADLPRPSWCVQAGTAVSSRVRVEAPNSVNLLRYGSARSHCTVERWDCIRPGARFELVEVWELPLHRESA